MKVRVSDQLHKREVKDRDGNTGNIWICEYSDSMIEARNDSTMVRNQRRGRGVDYDFKLRNIRRYDLVNGLVTWDFEDENGKEVELPPAGDAKARLRLFKDFDGYITQQIAQHIRDLNNLDMDEDAAADDKNKQENADPFADEDEEKNGVPFGMDPFADPGEDVDEATNPTKQKAS